MNLLKPVTLIFLMRTALSEFSMDTTPWVCTTHCENEGKCGDNNFNDYLLQSLALATANFKNMLAAITEYVRKLVQI